MHFLCGDARVEHKLLHRMVRHLNAIDLLMSPTHRLEARVELGHARCAGAPVEIGEAKPVAMPLEVVQEERELAEVEDRLLADAFRPCLGADLHTQSTSRPFQLARFVREHPVDVLVRDEETRVRRPAPGTQGDGGAPKRAPDRCHEAAREH